LLRLPAVVVALVVLGGGGWLLYGTEVFAVAQVRVSGTQVLTQDEVRAAAGIRRGTPLVRLDAAGAAGRVSELPPVARAVVRRQWPDTVTIRVTERTPVAVAPSPDGFLVLDRTGVVFDRVPVRPAELPLLELARPGPGDRATRDALSVLAALTPALRSVLVRLSAPSPTRISLRLTGGRVVVWGDSQQSEKKARVATVLLRHRVRVMDVSAPDVVTTR
jgi:cell division protein FtsQ